MILKEETISKTKNFSGFFFSTQTSLLNNKSSRYYFKNTKRVDIKYGKSFIAKIWGWMKMKMQNDFLGLQSCFSTIVSVKSSLK